MMSPYSAKRVVVTGAGGSIGSELCRQILKAGPRQLVLVSLTENALYNIMKVLGPLAGETELVPVLGDAGNIKLMRPLLARTDILIHAAAHKHVPICEENPVEAVLNNVVGTAILMGACIDAEVKQFLLVSSDKAVHPTSIMGATKRVAEMYLKYCARHRSQTLFSVVRFGNVIDSAGSVLPLWRAQIASGGPLTLTDERCTRYFMTIPEAVSLITGAVSLHEAKTFVFDMGEPKRMIDLAQTLIQNSGQAIQILITGLRQGEKLEEELVYNNDEMKATAEDRIFSVEDNSQLSMQKFSQLQLAAQQRQKDRTVQLLMELVA